MTSDNEIMYWHKNKDWWRFNDKEEVELTEEAPERAKKAFEEWKKH